MAKLTLNANPEIIERAKRLAADNHTSVSALFSRLIQALTHQTTQGESIGKLTRKASGTIELGRQSERDILTDSLQEKYGLNP
jgi:hypothetical protein